MPLSCTNIFQFIFVKIDKIENGGLFVFADMESGSEVYGWALGSLIEDMTEIAEHFYEHLVDQQLFR